MHKRSWGPGGYFNSRIEKMRGRQYFKEKGHMKWPRVPAMGEGAPGTPGTSSTSPVGISPLHREGWPWLLQPCSQAFLVSGFSPCQSCPL